MKIGIAGAGSIAFGTAALTASYGHSSILWSPSGNRLQALAQGAELAVTGAIETALAVSVARDAAALCAASDVIILCLPAYGHRMVLDALAPHIEARHSVIISAHLSFAALYLSKLLAARNCRVPIAAWSTTAVTAKALSPTSVRVGNVRSGVDMAVVPAAATQQMVDLCTAAFGDRFLPKDDILTIALSNLNPQNHMGIALCNLTRIERQESWGQNANITGTVGRLMEALDAERLLIAQAFGKHVRTLFEHYALSFAIEGGTVSEMSQTLAATGKDALGPTDIDTRYVHEDVPYGLVPLVRLAALVDLPMPLHESGIAILGACYGVDFSAGNDLLPALGTMTLDDLRHRSVQGY